MGEQKNVLNTCNAVQFRPMLSAHGHILGALSCLLKYKRHFNQICNLAQSTRDINSNKYINFFDYDEESDHSNKAVRKTPEIESGHKVSEEVK